MSDEDGDEGGALSGAATRATARRATGGSSSTSSVDDARVVDEAARKRKAAKQNSTPKTKKAKFGESFMASHYRFVASFEKGWITFTEPKKEESADELVAFCDRLLASHSISQHEYYQLVDLLSSDKRHWQAIQSMKNDNAKEGYAKYLLSK